MQYARSLKWSTYDLNSRTSSRHPRLPHIQPPEGSRSLRPTSVCCHLTPLSHGSSSILQPPAMAYARDRNIIPCSPSSATFTPRGASSIEPHARRDSAICQAHALVVEAATAAVVSEAGTAMAAAATASPLASITAVVLGYCCLVGSCFRSVPQIMKVVKRGSVEGLSVMANVAELLCYTIMTAYNFNRGYPFNAYGEVFACWVQDIVLVVLIFKHLSVAPAAAAAAALAFAALCVWLFMGGLPVQVLGYLQLSTIFVMAVAARLPQIVLNYRRGNAGVMSLTTCLLNVAGNAIRIFTTLVLTHDRLIMAGCLTQGTLNMILLYQTLCTTLADKQAAKGDSSAGAGPSYSPLIGPQPA